jgi:hypothetical protein
MVFMAVPVGAGAHEIEMRLRRPALVTLADWTTGATWTGFALALVGYAVVMLLEQARVRLIR